MEDFGARTIPTAEFCEDAVKSCDIFVGIVGQRYGSCPGNSKLSFSEIEYSAAVAAGLPTLMFMAGEEFPVPAKLIEPDEQRERLQYFRRRVLGSTPVSSFDTEASLTAE